MIFPLGWDTRLPQQEAERQSPIVWEENTMLEPLLVYLSHTLLSFYVLYMLYHVHIILVDEHMLTMY